MNDFERRIERFLGQGLYCRGIDILQANLGLRCNQQCRHCHLMASPDRAETMDWPIMESILAAVGKISCKLVDLTGGAPELNHYFVDFINALSKAGLRVQVRTNLTVLLEPGMDDMPAFFRANRVQLVGSLPCYLEENVSAQRGKGIYENSIEAVRRLNAAGYGREEGLALDLVYNPGGAFLPPRQTSLEADYKRELRARFGLEFNRLLTITNMPLGRFRRILRRENQEQEYLELLKDSFNPATLDSLMCRRQISVGWDGSLYDCDFNLALGCAVNHGAPNHIRSFEPELLKTRRIVTGDHCFGCTAGAGSSCGGALL
ncbi:MAG: radical SAM/Cys-rich domain protein [Candidatus Abyssobacteria bacterium SURF_5]|uniref:Radical SAM/Cys-rich domain protein n=1 Tax=Abyssobacteria bacterium (strain SURF_5) TaxID=2093360 RepID=A0A3A4NFV4_ABYX5|nr:MAG: radical SAM/Cys-rich domain protein [Candidatus Abyssubacteria bacterium SURF_5]